MTNQEIYDPQQDENLKIVVKINDNITFKKDKKNNVVVIQKNEAKIQKFMRKIKFLKIPTGSKTKLDEFSSFVWLQIDGQKTIYEIGQNIEQQFGEDRFVYDRLMIFLTHLEAEKRWISKVAN